MLVFKKEMEHQFNSIQHRFWNLFTKKVAGEASAAELKEFDQLLKEYHGFQHQVDMLSQMWQQESQVDLKASEEAFVRHLLKHKNEFFSGESALSETQFKRPSEWIEAPKKRYAKKLLVWMLVAMVLSVSLFFTLQTRKRPNLQPDALSSVITKNGSRTKISLPDGSQVWLNAGSKLDYNNNDFAKNTREVFLTGEAFFDVVKDPSHPFLVHTDNMQVKVLGTAFNVKAYPGERQTETSLIRGLVEVTIPSRPAEKYILNPNEKLILNQEGIGTLYNNGRESLKTEPKAEETIVSINKVNYLPEKNIILETAWVENRLEFKSEKFIDIARKMERWFDVSISFSNKNIEDKLLTGSFENETIEQALEALKMVEPFNYTIEDRKVLIKPL
jgi:ferric-dicitrate binding protein FerR (iron transport regulator)